MFFLFSQSDASKKKTTQKKTVAAVKRGGKAVATSLKSAAATVVSHSSMVVDGVVWFAMVVNLSLGFIDGGRWVFNSGQWLVDLVVEGGAWRCELESGFSR